MLNFLFGSLLIINLTGAAHISKNAHVDVTDDGTIRISGGDESIQAIRQAIRSGINFIDTSPFYGFGKSELIVAEVCCKFYTLFCQSILLLTPINLTRR